MQDNFPVGSRPTAADFLIHILWYLLLSLIHLLRLTIEFTWNDLWTQKHLCKASSENLKNAFKMWHFFLQAIPNISSKCNFNKNACIAVSYKHHCYHKTQKTWLSFCCVCII